MRALTCFILLTPLLLFAACDRSFLPSPAEQISSDSEGMFPFDFTLIDIHGETVSKSDFAGKVLVVDIWGTWCPPCREEVPHFVDLQDELGPEGLQIVGITYERSDSPQEAIASIKQFTETTEVNYPLLLGTQAIQEQIPDFNAFPTTLFIDRSGNVRLSVVGARSKRELKGIMQKLLDE